MLQEKKQQVVDHTSVNNYMNYLEFDFETENEAQCEILLALLADAGFESFKEEEDHLKAFIKETALDEAKFNDIFKILPLKFKQTIIYPKNWNAQWEGSFEPVIVNDFAAIRAGFHQPVKNVQHEIIITPKMSFGTGHHATTFLMIQQMSGLVLVEKKVFDFGTGTGVLAILAEKMGAKQITAIDNDEWSIDNSKENSIANGCSRINIQKADAIPAHVTFDIILANITLNVILSDLSGIAGAAEKGTRVLLSGFLKADQTMLFNELEKRCFVLISVSQKGEWICLHVQKT